MELIADILLVAGALGAGLYCFVLSRRLKRFTDLEQGVGGAVAVLSTQAEELKKSLDRARAASDRSGDNLQEITERAQSVAQRLELMMASMHDVIPEEVTPSEPVPNEAQPPEPAIKEDPPEIAKDREQKTDQSEQPAENEKTETPKEPDLPTETTATKAPEGLMFFRHDRAGNEAAE